MSVVVVISTSREQFDLCLHYLLILQTVGMSEIKVNMIEIV